MLKIDTHVCINPKFMCLTAECLHNRYLCEQCYDYKSLLHRQHLLSEIPAEGQKIIPMSQHSPQKQNPKISAKTDAMINQQLPLEATLIDIPTHVILKKQKCSDLEISEDGQLVATPQIFGKAIHLWNLNELTCRKLICPIPITVSKVSISLNNNYLAGYGTTPVVLLFSLNQVDPNYKLLQTQTAEIVSSIKFSSSSSLLTIMGKSIQVWNCSDGTLIKQFIIDRRFFNTLLTDNYVFLCEAESIQQFNINDGKYVKQIVSKQNQFTDLHASTSITYITNYLLQHHQTCPCQKLQTNKKNQLEFERTQLDKPQQQQFLIIDSSICMQNQQPHGYIIFYEQSQRNKKLENFRSNLKSSHIE